GGGGGGRDVGGRARADPRGRHRRARRARPCDRRARPRRAAPDEGPGVRLGAEAALRHRRLRARGRPGVRARPGRRRSPELPPALSREPPLPSPSAAPAPSAMAPSSAAMIEVAGLRVVIPPANAILDGIDLTVRASEFVVILGRSGAGKTTLLRSLNRLVEPTAGSVRVAGRVVTGAGAADLREARRQTG